MATKKTAKKTRKPNAAFMKPLQPDEALAQVVGEKPLPRTEITKRLWVYIKKEGLQDKKNRRNINADDAHGNDHQDNDNHKNRDKDNAGFISSNFR